jgi:acyl carrier protein
MTEPLADRVLKVLLAVAPDIDAQAIVPEASLRDQFDFDSMDTLQFAIALKREFGVDVPDSDFRELATLDRCVKYLATRLAVQPGA